MVYELMHKNIKVLTCEIDADRISKIINVFRGDHAPVGTQEKTGLSRKKLDAWFQRRSIPSSRDNIREVLDRLGIESTKELLDKAYALSLSDQYWIRAEGSHIRWESVNFFQNDFSEDLGNLLLGGTKLEDSEKLSLVSPDPTLDGWLRKKWKIQDGKRLLVKAGSGSNRQEPLNEKIAAEFCSQLGIKHIEYDVIFGHTGLPYSVCEDYIRPDTELITAYAMCSLRKQSNHESDIDFYNCICEEVGIKDISHRMDEMLCMDYIIANTDRHWTNFGVVRSADTLEFIETMPLFDNGSSLWHDVPDFAIGAEEVQGKLLRTSLERHLKYVKDPSFLDFSKMQKFPELAAAIFRTSATMSEERIEKIRAALRHRITRMEGLLIRSKSFTVTEHAKKIIAASDRTLTEEQE